MVISNRDLLLREKSFKSFIHNMYYKYSKNEKMKVLGGIYTRPYYAYGIYRACQTAKYFNKKSVLILEFGVADGAGLIQMIMLANHFSKTTGVEVKIVGFDSGHGLLELSDYRDHPEFYSHGDFFMQNKEQLLTRLGDKAKIVFGDVKDTVPDFISSLDDNTPIGFLSLDLDVYHGSKHALSILQHSDPGKYLPAISVYLDDIGFFFANKYCGELLAVEEFNVENEYRKIDIDYSLYCQNNILYWYKKMYVCHILDNKYRKSQSRESKLTSPQHSKYRSKYFF